MARSRRALLETAAATLTGGAVATLAGCLGVPSSTDSGDDTPSPTAETGGGQGGSMAFTRWFPDPTQTPLHDGYGVRYFDIARIRAHHDAIHENAYTRLEADMLRPVPNVSIDSADVEATVAIDHVMDLALGSFDPAAVEAAITERPPSTPTSTRTPTTPTRTPWQEPERYRGFDLYGTDYVFAVSEDAVMQVGPAHRGDSVDLAKAIIDTAARQSREYTASNEYVASMFGTVDAPHALWCFPEAMDGSTSRGFRADSITGGLKAWQFGSETARLTYANTYVDTDVAASGELQDFIESNSDRFGPYDGLDVEVDGRMAWTDGTIPTNEFDYLSAGGPDDTVFTPN